MERGFIKLWRVIDQNDLLEYDNAALVVFMKLLIRADRMSGTYRTGRYRLAEICNMPPSTVRDALKRLEAATIIRQQTDSKATTIYICNWWKYQQDNDSKPSEARRADDTKQEKKENIDTKVSNNKALTIAKTPNNEINEMFEQWSIIIGYAIDGQKQKNRYACSNLLKKYGKEGLTQMIRGVSLAQEDKFAPRISDFASLQAKQNDLIAWGKTKKISTMKKVAII